MLFCSRRNFVRRVLRLRPSSARSGMVSSSALAGPVPRPERRDRWGSHVCGSGQAHSQGRHRHGLSARIPRPD
jgi:hypothetical protein